MVSTFVLGVLAFQAASTQMPAGGVTAAYSGREGRLSVPLPRVEASIETDGALTEPVWQQAALLNAFTQFAPTDNQPAADSTQVLVWYSPTAIHFGIRAFESHGTPTATLPERDRIFGDDNIQILIGTFHDGRQALMFAVNPRGVQADGALIEGRNVSAGGSFNSAAVIGREQADLSPNWVWQSNGRVTEFGYEVEIRIPFKSLRYQSANEQSWHLNVMRQVRHSGFEDAWAPVQRTNTAFLSQAGELTGLRDLRRGLVVELNPELTMRATGAPTAAGYDYTRENAQLGVNMRWGITTNLNLNLTAHPDYSQIESDAGQLNFDPRQALFFAERRPFFLEANELFAVPFNLIYTRRIVQPVAAVKLTGNVSGTNIGLLSAVDDQDFSRTGDDNPIFNILRLQRPLGGRSRIGLAYTDRIDGSDYNRVADVDGRIGIGRSATFNFQLAGSTTRINGVRTSAPLWSSSINVRGQRFGFNGVFQGIGDKFRTQSGFTSRAGIVYASVDPSITWNLSRDNLLQRFTFDINYNNTWQYVTFRNGGASQDRKVHFNANAALRGGWTAGVSLLTETFGYDAAIYQNYRLEVPSAAGGGALDTIPFPEGPRLPNLDYIISIGSPQFRHFSFNFFTLWGRDENFFEWASGDIIWITLGATFRPSERARAELSYNMQQVRRPHDGSLVNRGQIPRLKLEYQVSRPLFVRIVGQYRQEQTDSLRDYARTGAPILIATPGGVVRTQREFINEVHGEALVSYQPVPGTVILVGYGSDMTDGGRFRFNPLVRTSDAFFAKVTYLFRL